MATEEKGVEAEVTFVDPPATIAVTSDEKKPPAYADDNEVIITSGKTL